MGNGHHAVLATCKEVIGLALPPVLVNLHGSKHQISDGFEFICNCSQAGILVIFLSEKEKKGCDFVSFKRKGICSFVLPIELVYYDDFSQSENRKCKKRSLTKSLVSVH